MKVLSLGAGLGVLLSESSASAQIGPVRLRANPLRARRARALALRELYPSPPDGGLAGDGGTGEETDGGGIIGDDGFWWIGSVSPDNISIVNSGVQAVIQEVDAPPSGGGCFDCWTSEYLDNGMWGQVGFSACQLPGRDPSLVTFYQIWDTSHPLAEVLLVDANSEITSPGIHSYAMNVENGTDWAYSVDGTVFGSYDMGSAISTHLGSMATMCEEGDGVRAPFAPEAVSAPAAMLTLNAGGWAGAPSANVYNSANLSGVTGFLQNSTLAPGAILIGGDSSFDTSGTMLWDEPTPGFAPDAGPAGTSALAPPKVSLLLPTPNATVSGTVEIYGTVSNPPTAPAVAQVNIFVQDLTGVRKAHWSLHSPPFDVDWFTTGLPDERYLVFMQVIDTQGKQTYMDIAVTLDNESGIGTAGTGGSLPGTGTGTSGQSGGPASNSTSGGESNGVHRGATGTSSSSTPSSRGCSTGAGSSSSLLLLTVLARRRHWRFASKTR